MRFLFLISFSIFQVFLFGQGSFEKIFTIDDGLPSQIVYDVEQDELGYIWVATEGGLSKYNGESFTNFSVKDGLHYNEIVSLIKDPKGRIWLNSVGPFGYIENGEIRYLDLPYQQNLFRNFNVVKHGPTLYIMSGSNLFLLDNETLELKSQKLNIKIGNSYKTNVLKVENDSLWIHFNNSIYIIYDEEIKDSIALSNDFGRDLSENFIYLYKAQNLYYMHNNSFIKFDRNTGESKIVLSNINKVAYIIELYGRVYLYYNTGGSSSFTFDKNGDLENFKEGDSEKIISNLMIDKEGNHWMSLYTKGLQFSPTKNNSVNSYTTSDFKHLTQLESIFIDRDKLWLGNQNGELLLFENDRWEKYDIPIKNDLGISRILDINSISDNVLIISSDAGIYLFYTDTKKFKYIYKSASKKISIFEDKVIISTFNKSYLVTKSCLLNATDFKKDMSTADFFKTSPCFEILYEGRSYSSSQNSKGDILLGHVAQGLIGFYSDTSYYFNDASNLFNVNINKIITAQDNSFIAATKGQGIYLIDGFDYSLIDNSNGLSSNICTDVIQLGSTLYAATNEGLNIIRNFQDKKILYIEVLKKVNDLLDNELRGIAIKDSLLYAISHKGLNTINLSKIETKDKINNILIESVKINNEVREYEDNYKLDPNENSVSISFANLDYTNFKTASYSYRLIGLEKEWNHTNASEIRYSGLDSGEYTFQVCKAGLENIDQEWIKSLHFTIANPFHKSSFFRILLSLFVIGFIILLSNALSSRNSRLYLESKVNERTKELNVKLEEIDHINTQLERSNKELQDYAHVTSHDLKSPLRTISSFVSLLAKKNKDNFDEKDFEYVEFVKKGINRMNQVVQDLLDLSKVSSKKDIDRVDVEELIKKVLKDLNYQIYKKKVKVILSGDFPVLYLSETNLKQLFQNLISNSIKYNDNAEPKVEINCKEVNEIFMFRVRDNGIGFDEKYRNEIFEIFKRLHGTETYDGTGIGLAICKKIVEDYKGEIYAESELGIGSVFYINLPISLSKLPI